MRKLNPIQRELLRNQVIIRDEEACQGCGRYAAEAHHIIPRSRGTKYSPKLWRVENMCCLCLDCHKDGQTTWKRLELLEVMRNKHDYDMGWVKEFGIAMEGE